jgi:hypothetical protein
MTGKSGSTCAGIFTGRFVRAVAPQSWRPQTNSTAPVTLQQESATPKTKNKDEIMTTARNKFVGLGYDGNFGGLDLSGCPSIQPPLSSSDSGWLDPRFAPMDLTGQSNALKDFIVQQTAEHTPPTTVFTNGSEFRVFYREGAWHGEGTVDGSRRRYSASDRDALLSKSAQATKPRELHRSPIPYRDLNEKELLEIARYVQSGDTQAALSQYMYFATDKREIASPFEILDDPRYKGLCDAAVLFVWQHSRTDYSPSPEREQYIDTYAASRPLSLALLDSAWKACQESEKRGALLYQLQPEPEVADPRELQDSLEESTDDEIERMMAATKREYAREVRAGRR